MIEGFLVADPATGDWSFVGNDAPERPGEYNVPVRELLQTPEAFCDWIAHLAEKTWFRPQKFFHFFTRFRENNDLFNQL